MSKPSTQPGLPDDPNRPNTKRTGERSEAAFLYMDGGSFDYVNYYKGSTINSDLKAFAFSL